MKVERLSSSAIKTYDFCEFQYYLNYHIGLPSISGKAALIGTIVHATLATLARKGNKWPWQKILDRYWDFYALQRKDLDMRKWGRRGELADWKKAKKCVETIINSIFNPTKLDILSIEDKFRLYFKEEKWTTAQGKKLAVSGIMDLVHRINKNTIEIIDWKTGRRASFGSNKPLDLTSLPDDIQPRIYHMAAHQLWPEYENVLVTFHYIREGGAYPVSLGRNDIAETQQIIYDYFRRIKMNNRPYRIKPSWKCKLCSFNKNDLCDELYESLRS